MFLNQRMGKENVVHLYMEYYSAPKYKDIFKCAGKWMKLEKKNHPEGGNPNPERHAWHILKSGY